jgi:hypothetical protein
MIPAALVSAQSAAQLVSVHREVNGPSTITMGFGGRHVPSKGVQNAPYSGVEITEHNQTLADGTNIVQPAQKRLIYRDSMGRTRTDRPAITGLRMDTEDLRIVEIVDPVAQVWYVLDPQNRVAHKSVAEPPQQRTAAQRPASASAAVPRPGGMIGSSGGGTSSTTVSEVRQIDGREYQTEQLGQQVFDGVTAEGTRTTTTVPIGLEGNDRPMVSTSENWYSQQLRLAVYTRRVDPRNGESTTRLTEISTSEPDPSLFQPPADYTVVEEKGQFQITLTRE